MQLAGTQLTASPITIPELAAGEIWIGVVSVGAALHHVILLPGDFEGPHAAMMAKAAELGGDLPTRVESALLFAEAKAEFKPDYYWTKEQHASDESYAWVQDFTGGSQYCLHKDNVYPARAVRRVPIQ